MLNRIAALVRLGFVKLRVGFVENPGQIGLTLGTLAAVMRNTIVDTVAMMISLPSTTTESLSVSISVVVAADTAEPAIAIETADNAPPVILRRVFSFFSILFSLMRAIILIPSIRLTF